MSIPDRIDIIAAAALQGLLAGKPWPTQRTMDEAVRSALEMGQRYHALRNPELPMGPPEPRKPPPAPLPTATDINVVPICGGLGDLKAVDVMGRVS